MNKLTTEYLKDVLITFKFAPNSFYSPCGRDTNISINEIELRSFMVPNELKIYSSEVIFRRLWEITKEDVSAWEKEIPKALDFFKELNYDENFLKTTIDGLVKEINYLDKNKGRIIHNPF